MENTHKTTTVWVKASVDVGIAELVTELQTFPGVFTDASCQGTLNDGGIKPYPPYAMVHWADEAALLLLQAYHTVDIVGDSWGYVRPAGSPGYEWGSRIQPHPQGAITQMNRKPKRIDIVEVGCLAPMAMAIAILVVIGVIAIVSRGH